MGSIFFFFGGGEHSNIIEPSKGICREEICTQQGGQKFVRTSTDSTAPDDRCGINAY